MKGVLGPFDYLPAGSTTPLFPRARPASSRWLRASWAAWVGLGLGLGLGLRVRVRVQLIVTLPLALSNPTPNPTPDQVGLALALHQRKGAAHEAWC